MFPSNGERTTIADRGVEVGEPQAGHRKGKERKEKKPEGRGDRVTQCLSEGQSLFVECCSWRPH